MREQWTFRRWIESFKDVDLPIGDLARDIKRCPDFPNSNDYEELRYYIVSKGASTEALDTLRSVFDFFLDSAL